MFNQIIKTNPVHIGLQTFVKSLGHIQMYGISKAPWWGLPGSNPPRRCLVQEVPASALVAQGS